MNKIAKKTIKKNSEKTLVLLDAHAIIHRAYHALPEFSNSSGQATGALYGLITMLIRILQDYKPDFLIAAYDLPKPTFRHQAYEAYKGKRLKTDDALVEQLQSSREVFDAFGIPHIDAEGFEADDVLGTLVEQFKNEAGVNIIIASGDMDTLQLVEGKKVQVYTLKKGVTDTVLYDEEGVRARFGFAPLLLPDYKGLRGDPSDNILGVPGIGEKTATTLITSFGTIESIYNALKKYPVLLKEAGISDRTILLLKEHEEEAFFSKTLATIRRDAPITYSLPEAVFAGTFDVEKVLALCNRYEFRSLIPRVKNILLEKKEIAAKQLEEKNNPAVSEMDTALLRETAIMLWVLQSDQTNPTLDTILFFTKKNTLAEAHTFLLQELEKHQLKEVFEYIEKPIIPIVENMERYGVLIDRACFEKLSQSYQTQLAQLEKEITEMAGVSFNLNSPKQLSEILFQKLALKTKGKRKASGAFTTNADALEGLRDTHPIIGKILEYREAQKLLSTYINAIPGKADAAGRLHAKFFQHGTTTGRFSSTDPNLQNLPARGETGKAIRQGFVAPKGSCLLSCDYAQIELRVLATLSGDEKLIASFQSGEDVHASVASYMFKIPLKEVTSDMRRKAKVINFGILYGMGVTALQKNLNTTRSEAQVFYDNYFKTFPTVASYMESSKRQAQEYGYTQTYFGRRRYFAQMQSQLPHLRAFAERMAANAPIQGTAADIIKLAIQFTQADIAAAGLADKVHLTMQIHDELVYEIEESVKEEARAIIVKAMEEVFERSFLKKKPAVPIAVSSSFGKSLGEVK